jgi:hypothetical protein
VAILCAGLAACDTLHGFQIAAVPEQGAHLPEGCVAAGIQAAGMRATPNGTQLLLSDPDGAGAWFSVDSSNSRGIRLYAIQMGKPMSCSEVQQVVPRMRAVMQSVLAKCSTNAVRIAPKESWPSQDSCGF